MTFRFKPLAIFVTITLLAWLLPLGAFIGASQQGTACGGKRAFHMCQMMKGKVSTASSATVSFSNAGGYDTAKASGSAGDDLVLASAVLSSESQTRSLTIELFRPSKGPSLSPLGPPPKVSLF